jgi:RimJ/RimL family protein N-acetyltransferase
MIYQIRALTVADAAEFRRVRLDALRLHPEAFAADYAEEAALSEAQFAERLSAPGLTRFGGFAGNKLVGLVGLSIRAGAKEDHKAYLFSMYVDAAHRGTDVARRLVETVIAGARDAGAVVLQLSVTVGNLAAQRLYRRMGFVPYGTERRALKIGGRYYDEEEMALDLDQSDPAP